MTPLRWAILGTGWMCRQIAEGIAAQPDAVLAAVVSRSGDRAAAFVERHGGRPYTSEEAMLSSAAVDVVYIGTPNALHPAQALRAIRAGRHVLCDKPLALTVRDADEVRAAAAKAGVTLSVVFQTRRHPGLARVRAAIESGAIGEPGLVEVRLSFGVETLEGWRSDEALAGAGSFHNLGVHAVDTLSVVAGAPIVDVVSIRRPRRAILDRTTTVLVRCANEVLGTAVVSQELAAEDLSVTVRGTRGSIRWDGWLAPYRSGEVVVSAESGVERSPAEAPDIYARAVRSFQDAVLAGAPPDPTPEEAVRSVAIAVAVAAGPTTAVTGIG